MSVYVCVCMCVCVCVWVCVCECVCVCACACACVYPGRTRVIFSCILKRYAVFTVLELKTFHEFCVENARLRGDFYCKDAQREV